MTVGDATRDAVAAAVPGGGAEVVLLVAGGDLLVNPHTVRDPSRREAVLREEALLSRRLGRLSISILWGEALLEAFLILLRLGGGSHNLKAVSACRLLTVAGSDHTTPDAGET